MPLDPPTRQLIQDGLHELLRRQLVREVKVATPAAGADWLQAVPGGIIWELLTITQLLTASAAVANRQPIWIAKDGDGNVLQELPTNTTVTANQAQRATAMTGLGAQSGSLVFQGPLPSPPLVLLPGWTIGSTTNAIDAGDQYSAVILTVRVWSESQIVLNAGVIGRALQSLTLDK